MKILPICYLPPVSWFRGSLNTDKIILDVHEHYIKQTWRNRCVISGANGKISLVIPVAKHNDHTPIGEIKISYRDDWQRLHWRSIESAYRRSPYFEYYEHHFSPFYGKPTYEYLYQFNIALLDKILETGKKKIDHSLSEEYIKTEPDLRMTLAPRKKHETDEEQAETYTQVFENKLGFIPGLSIIDKFFNTGSI